MATRITDLPAPPEADGTRFDWGIVGSTDPLNVRINGAGTAVNVANRAREASIVEAGDKVLLMRTGYGGWTYIDRIVDVIVRPTPDVPITSLQPTPDDTPGMPPTTPEGELPTFLELNAPTNVLITNILWDRFTVSYDYTRNTAANAPIETGFQINIVRVATNEVVQTEYVDATTRSVRVGSLTGSVFYRAEVRTITTEARAFTAYTEAQVRLYFSITGRQLPSLYSAWAVSRRAQTDDPPVAPVAPPINLRWGSVGEDYVTIHWDYQPLPGFATATGFQVRACQNSIATVGCVPPHTAARTARFQRVTPVEGSKSYWGFVRTIASMPDPQNPQNPPIVRYSNWVAVGPPRRTHTSTNIEFRNFNIRRIGQTSDVRWSVEVRNASQFRIQTTYQQRREVNQLTVDAGPPRMSPLGEWLDITDTYVAGDPDQQGWRTILLDSDNDPDTIPDGRDVDVYHGIANYTVTVTARNDLNQAQTSATLAMRAPPDFVYQQIFQLGNRVIHTIAQAVLAIPGLRGIAAIGPFLRGIGSTARDLARFFAFGLRKGVPRNPSANYKRIPGAWRSGSACCDKCLCFTRRGGTNYW